MRETVRINDVGPRDGLQSLAKILSPQDRLKIIHGLVNAGLPSVEVGSFVSPAAVPSMAGTDEVVKALAHNHDADYQVLVPNIKGYNMASALGVSTVELVFAASETMNQRNIRMSIAASLDIAKEIFARSESDGIKVIPCISTAWECPFEGPIAAQEVLGLCRALTALGAKEVSIADTIGAANPAQVHDLMAMLIAEFGAEHFSCHFHDTRAMGMANVYAATALGVRKFDSSIGGLGGCPFAPGASGNVATEDLVMMLEQMGYSTGINLSQLMKVADSISDLLGEPTGGRADQWRRLRIAQYKPFK